MKPNSDWHFNNMPDNEPFRAGLGHMVSVKLQEYHALLAAKERVEAIEKELEELKAKVKQYEKRRI